MTNKKITHHEFSVNGEYMEIKKVSDQLLKEEIAYKKDERIYAYRGERIVENLYVKGMFRDTPTYKALVNELEKRKRKELDTHFRGAFVCGKFVRYE